MGKFEPADRFEVRLLQGGAIADQLVFYSSNFEMIRVRGMAGASKSASRALDIMRTRQQDAPIYKTAGEPYCTAFLRGLACLVNAQDASLREIEARSAAAAAAERKAVHVAIVRACLMAGCGSKPMGFHFGVGAPPSLIDFSWD